MNTRLLEYFTAVAEYSSFKKAADLCGVSQPALSIQLKKLEKQLGVSLFERTTQQVVLTHTGESLLASARTILTQVRELKLQAQLHSDPYAGDMYLGAFPTLAPSLFAHLVPELQNSYPNMYFHLVEEKTEVLIEKLLSGDLDLVFVALPEEHPQLVSKELYSEDFYVALPETHDLNDAVTLKDLQDENLLLLEDGHCLRDQALDICAMSQLNPQADFNASSLTVLLHMIQLGNGITLVPEKSRLEIKGVKYLPFKENSPGRRIAVFWRKTSVRQAIFEEIADDIVREFKEKS